MTPNTFLTEANAAFRNKDFGNAIDLYEKALIGAVEPVKTFIKFNLQLAELRLAKLIDNSITIKKNSNTSPLAALLSEVDDKLASVIRDMKNDFDETFYRSKYPDVDIAGIDCLEHYCNYGWREGRDPRSDFSTADYLEQNSDVKEAGINPFWHYVVSGKAEGRESEHPGRIKAEVLKRVTTVDQIVQQWKRIETPPDLMTNIEVLEKIKKQLSLVDRPLVLSIGHDNYKKISGGIQLCIQQEEKLASQQGTLYLNVHPWQPLPVLSPEKESPDPAVTLILAGKEVGTCLSSVVTESIRKINSEFHTETQIIVHSLMGHSTKHVKDWIALRKDRHAWLWLHDFFTLCPSYALQRNNISFCGAPDINSNACGICVYGESRRSHEELICNFFLGIEITVISPSDVAKEFWLTKFRDLSNKVLVSPHSKLNWSRRDNNLSEESTRCIAIAYVGAAMLHKGWPVFEELYRTLSDDSRYQFFYFGNQKPPLNGIKHIPVHVTGNNPCAMANAISEAEIDFVIHWGTCFETFSFTTHEAIAGGAYVITHPFSGNVASVVTKSGKGLVIPDVKGLLSFFKDDSSANIVKILRKNNATHICTLDTSEMTLPFLSNKESV